MAKNNEWIVNHQEMRDLLRQFRKTKAIFPFIWGTFGIGKSEGVCDDSKEYAISINREWKDFKELSRDEKLALLDGSNLSKIHLWFDVRTALLEPTDLMGVPFAEGDYVSWKPNLMMKLLSMPEVSATLFFDEFNLGSRMVQNSAYQILLDKAIGEISFGRDVFIVGAGNRIQDGSNIIEMTNALKNRVAHLILGVPTNDEFIKWLLNSKYPDTRICALLKFAPELVWNYQTGNSENAFATPRSIFKLAWTTSELDENKEMAMMKNLATAICGSPFSAKYEAFLRLSRKIDVDDILANPKKVREIREIDLKYALVSGVANKMRGKGWTENYEKALLVAENLDDESSVFLLKMIKEIVSNAKFIEKCLKSDTWNDRLTKKVGDLFKSV